MRERQENQVQLHEARSEPLKDCAPRWGAANVHAQSIASRLRPPFDGHHSGGEESKSGSPDCEHDLRNFSQFDHRQGAEKIRT